MESKEPHTVKLKFSCQETASARLDRLRRSVRAKIVDSKDIRLRNALRASRRTLNDTGCAHSNIAQEQQFGDYIFSVGGGKSNSINMWLVDSGATQHMTNFKELIRRFKEFGPVDVHLADDGVAQAIGKGDIVMSMRTRQGVKKGDFKNVW